MSNQNSNTISCFAGTGPATFATTATTISGPGQGGPQGLAFDASGNLFAASFDDLGRRIGTITELDSTGLGTFGPGATFATGLNDPEGLAFDTRGDLFAANFGGNSITEFAVETTPGTFGIPSTLTSGLIDSRGLAADARRPVRRKL